MMTFLQKAFAGLEPAYFRRQLFFGCLFPLMVLLITLNTGKMPPLIVPVLCLINTALYPYSRFVYESIVGYVMGNNLFVVNALMMLVTKLMTMTLCWAGAVFIAPIGLLYLGWKQSR